MWDLEKSKSSLGWFGKSRSQCMPLCWVPSLALIQCHLVVPIYVLQCSNPGAEQAPFSHSGTFLFKDPAVDCPTGQQEMSFNCALHTERKIGPASKLHVSFPYPLSIPISMCREHIHIHNISIHIHEPCPDFRPQDQVPPNNPIGIQGEAGNHCSVPTIQMYTCNRFL